MILRKPYAFLIKYFRIIHFSMVIFLGFVAYKLSAIIKFFNTYISNGYTTTVTSNLDSLYTPLSLYLMLIFIVIFAFLILLLLRHKEKPYGLYLYTILYYFALFVGLFYISNVLRGFEDALLASTTARSIRDIVILAYIPQFVFCLLMFVRAIGFDVKKFDFGNDVKELNLSSSDNEEFELNIGFEGYKAKRGIRRFFREFKYYLKENKLLFIIIGIIIIIVTGILIFSLYHKPYDTKLNNGTDFYYNNLYISFGDSIITKYDYSGNEIDGNYYLVVKMHILNNSGNSIKIDYNNFKLNIGNSIISPSIELASYFKDFASSSLPSSISHKSDKYVALVYKIERWDITKDAQIKIYNGTISSKKGYVDKNMFIELNPNFYDDIEIVGNYYINDEINFDKSLVGNSKLVFTEYSIQKKYIYDYESCNKDECKTYKSILTSPITNNRKNNYILVMKYEYEADLSNPYMNGHNIKDFALDFIKIGYKVGDNYFNEKSIAVTPEDSNGFIAFEVPSDINDASVIQALITIRNKQYILNLKI